MDAREAQMVHRSRPSTMGTLTYVLLGPILWSAHFAAMYGVQSTACAVGGSAAAGPVVATVAALATAVVLLLLAGAVVRARTVGGWLHARPWPNPAQQFCDSAMRLLAMLSCVGTIWAGATVLLVPACPPLR